MSSRILLFFACVACFGKAVAAEPSMGPVLQSFGPTFPLQSEDLPLPKDFAYKVVFDVAEYSDTAALNEQLVSVARFINMHVRSGVPIENLDLVVVLHGNALKGALADEAYLQRFKSRNPNLGLVLQLHEAGVSIIACGQSLGFRQYKRDELVPAVQVGLSAMTILTVFQAQGYSLLP
jgi:intracellular sulfur oxidation DsrE/DsrF family protein